MEGWNMDTIDFTQGIESYFRDISTLIKKLNQTEIDQAMNAMIDAYSCGADIYSFGNGGSAATASHMMNDFNKGVSYKLEKKFRFHCLNDNTAMLTAIANDIGYPYIFSVQMEGKLRAGDLVIAISGSGNSENVIRGVEYAKSCGCRVIGITGYDGGKLWKMSDYHLHVPSFDMQVVEDIHMIFNHMIMKCFCQVLHSKP